MEENRKRKVFDKRNNRKKRNSTPFLPPETSEICKFIMVRKKTITTSILFVLLFFTVSCQNDSKNEISENIIDVNWENMEQELQPFSEEFCDFELIPLDNRQEAQLGKIVKLIVTDSGMYIYDYTGQKPRILSFDLNGTFKRKIGDFGHSNAEYSYVYNFNASEDGDTITILDTKKVIYYDAAGHHLFTVPLKSYGDSDILQVPGGFWLVSLRRYKDNFILAHYDTNGDIREEAIKTDSIPIRFVQTLQNWYAIQKDENHLCLLDPFSSTFYLFDEDCPLTMSCYRLTSPTMITEERCREQEKSGTGFNYEGDAVKSYIYSNGVIRGVIRDAKGRPSDFSMNLADKTLKLMHHDSFNYLFDAYYNSFYYKFIPADALIDYAKNSNPRFKVIHDLLKDAIEPIKDTISEDDNFYLLRMRLKE